VKKLKANKGNEGVGENSLMSGEKNWVCLSLLGGKKNGGRGGGDGLRHRPLGES